MNRWKDIYDALDNAGLEVYAAGAHPGVCISPYCVVRQYGSMLQSSSAKSGYARYRVHLLTPADQPSLLDGLAASVRAALSPMEEDGILVLAVPCGATVTDDDFEALTTYIEYVSFYSETQHNSNIQKGN